MPNAIENNMKILARATSFDAGSLFAPNSLVQVVTHIFIDQPNAKFKAIHVI